MTLHCFFEAPGALLQEALLEFEGQFNYPLGVNDRFRIHHGSDYTRFFRAMGRGAVFVWEQAGVVGGVLSCAIRSLKEPANQAVEALYLCDLKVLPGANRGWVLLSLLTAVGRRFPEQSRRAYAVVMDGTSITPERYTGRLGIPPFEKLGQVAILKLAVTAEIAAPASQLFRSNLSSLDFHIASRRLSAGSFCALEGVSDLRSSMSPRSLLLSDDSGCGYVEDTELAKQLISELSGPMSSAHLSNFAYQSCDAACKIILKALSICQEVGRPSLFVAIPIKDCPTILASLALGHVTETRATIYGTGFQPDQRWLINSSEI
jgi:hypothetical protein